MKVEGWILIFVFVGLVALIARPMGLYLAAVFDGRRTWLSPVFAPLGAGHLSPWRRESPTANRTGRAMPPLLSCSALLRRWRCSRSCSCSTSCR